MNKLEKIAKAVIPYGIIWIWRKLTGKNIKEFQRWYADNGDETLRLNYEKLNPDSIVFDLGGYKGDFASNIFSKYCCNVYVFELVQKYAQNIQNRFSKNPKIKVFPFGLGAKRESFSISIKGASSSKFKNGKQTNEKQNCEIICFKDFLDENNINYINLIKINIEGGEYELLNYFIETGLIFRIENLQIQFHDFVLPPPQCKYLRERIQQKLSLTHSLTYNYDFVWENWSIK